MRTDLLMLRRNLIQGDAVVCYDAPVDLADGVFGSVHDLGKDRDGDLMGIVSHGLFASKSSYIGLKRIIPMGIESVNYYLYGVEQNED